MINTTNADKVLQSVYLDVVGKQINTTTSPFYNMIETGVEGIVGKEFFTNTRLGISSGIGCSSDESSLPESGSPIFYTFKAPLINIYGNVEITDKALRATSGNPGQAVDLLNTEMENLIRAAKYNFDRMLYQDGNGKLCQFVENSSASMSSSASIVYVNSTKNLIEGMMVDTYKNTAKTNATPNRITAIDRTTGMVKLDGSVGDLTVGNQLVMQGAYRNEMYGLQYLFATSQEINTIYGNLRSQLATILPTTTQISEVNGNALQEIIDAVEERSASRINLILASYDMRRKYLAALREMSINVDYTTLDGGFKSLSYNGIPVYAARFAPDNTMYFVNTDDFKLGQLADWTWIESANGKVLRQLENKAAYGATLVKYANLICKRPMGQAKAVYVEPEESDDH